MTLSQERRDAIYNSVHAALLHDYCHTCVLYGAMPTIINPSTRLDVDIMAAIKAVMDVVHSAAADAAERFNEAACGVLTQLPPELLVQAFSHLPLSDIVRLTRTSRLIRTITRNAPSLWTDVNASRLPYRSRLEGVKHLLTISKRSPLDIYFSPSRYDDRDAQILQLLVSESSRIRSLSIYNPEGPEAGSPAFFMKPMPVLRSLDTYSRHVTTLNSDWAPNARYVEIRGPFALPSAGRSPFGLLTHFWGYMEMQRSPCDARRLFRLCPLLVSLRLDSITRAALPFLPEAPFPRTLVDIHLKSDCDLTTYVEQFYGLHLRNLQIEGKRAAQCVITLWFSFEHTSWGVDLVHSAHTLEEADKSMRFVVNDFGFQAALLALAVPGASCFVNLTTLRIQWDQMDAILAKIDTLPSLVQLDLDITGWIGPRQGNKNTLYVPQLRIVNLNHNCSYASKLFEENDLLRSLRLTADETFQPLPRLVLRGPSVSDVQCADITALTRYARDIYVGEQLFWTREEDALAGAPGP